MKYIDLFAGGGGLSEGFKKAGYDPIAHVEKDRGACYTLKTRSAYYYLSENGSEDIYYSYLKGELTRDDFYSSVPDSVLEKVINSKIGKKNESIFKKIDTLLDGREVDLVIGGPPCQAYSYIGRAALKHRKNDERKTLYLHYGKFLKKYQPKIFIFENVPGILTSGNGKHYENLKGYYRSLGYEVEAQSHNAYDFGVVQHRERVIIIGWQKTLNFEYPDFENIEEKFYRDAIFKDLPPLEPGSEKRFHNYSEPANKYLKEKEIRNGVDFVTQHITRPHNKKDLNIYKLAIEKLEEGKRLKNNQVPEKMRTQKNVTDFLDRFKVVDDEPHTMIAHIAKDGHHFIHPDKNQLRSLSVREAARIQSFPDNYHFESIMENKPRTAAFRQIGNAVPPLMAEKIAKRIKKDF